VIDELTDANEADVLNVNGCLDTVADLVAYVLLSVIKGEIDVEAWISGSCAVFASFHIVERRVG